MKQRKRRPTQRKKHPLDRDKKHPPFGATKKQGDAYAKTRAVSNRIHELETALCTSRDRLTATTVALDKMMTAVHKASPTPELVAAMRKIVDSPISVLVSVGLQREVVVMALWLSEFDESRRSAASQVAAYLATGNPQIAGDPAYRAMERG